ncbi:DHS-like NAD/FAD-binding domain-containing protein [Chytriomyces sp. MP71]|nr:DHS-like NAD/FAD-binding domain-containing protein [Chytriomyces sp. MP71]
MGARRSKRRESSEDGEYDPRGSTKRRRDAAAESESDNSASEVEPVKQGSPQTYAERLLPIADKGVCGDAETHETHAAVAAKVAQLAHLLRDANGRALVHTGAGISTAAGVPDFRGPNGVWTCELQSKPKPHGVKFGDAKPTLTHKAINTLIEHGFLSHVNVDGLHTRSGLPREVLSEVHGTAFAEWCKKCNKEWRTETEVATIGLKKTGNKCLICGTPLRDMLCDWDSQLPDDECARAIEEHKKAQLVICVGSSLRIRPAGLWPMKTKRKGKGEPPGKIALINLQKTHIDKQCDIRIFAKCDLVFQMLLKELGLQILEKN